MPHDINKAAISLSPRRLAAVIDVLGDDVLSCTNALSQEGNANRKQFWARSFIRSTFAFIEGAVYEFKLMVLEAAQSNLIDLSLAERTVLSDLGYDVDDSGAIAERPRFVATDRNVRFVFALLVRVFGTCAQLDLAGQGYADFKA